LHGCQRFILFYFFRKERPLKLGFSTASADESLSSVEEQGAGTPEKGYGKRGQEAGFQGGEKREKYGKITQHCAIFCSRKTAMRREPTKKMWEPGFKSTGSGKFDVHPPLPHNPHLSLLLENDPLEPAYFVLVEGVVGT